MGTRDRGRRCAVHKSAQFTVHSAQEKMVIFQVNVELFGRFDNRTYVLRNYEI
jgi:hypothetical protein